VFDETICVVNDGGFSFVVRHISSFFYFNLVFYFRVILEKPNQRLKELYL